MIRSRKPKWSTYASKYAAICVWCGKSGYVAGIGKSAYSIRPRDVLMCSDRYAADMPLRFLKTQLPPMRSDASKQSNPKPRWCSALTAAIPEEPAPITQTVGSRVMRATLAQR